MVAIVICGVVVALIAIPMLGFLGFHIYLALTGKTTRELLKDIQREENTVGNQWCNVDPPLFDPNLDIAEA